MFLHTASGGTSGQGKAYSNLRFRTSRVKIMVGRMRRNLPQITSHSRPAQTVHAVLVRQRRTRLLQRDFHCWICSPFPFRTGVGLLVSASTELRTAPMTQRLCIRRSLAPASPSCKASRRMAYTTADNYISLPAWSNRA